MNPLAEWFGQIEPKALRVALIRLDSHFAQDCARPSIRKYGFFVTALEQCICCIGNIADVNFVGSFPVAEVKSRFDNYAVPVRITSGSELVSPSLQLACH